MLEREVSSNKQLYDLFKSRAKEMERAAATCRLPARIVDPAVVRTTIPRVQVPQQGQIILVASVLGLMIEAMGAVLLERMDNTIKGSESAELKLQQPVLAVLPAPERRGAGERGHDVHPRAEFADYAEAIRTARHGHPAFDVDPAAPPDHG